MKIIRSLLYLALFLAVYFWIYERYLFETVYLQYLPNYEHEVEFPLYDGITGEVINSDVAVSDQEKDFLPVYAFILYRLAQGSLILTPCLFALIFVVSPFICVINRKSNSLLKWAIVQYVLLSVVVVV